MAPGGGGLALRTRAVRGHRVYLNNGLCQIPGEGVSCHSESPVPATATIGYFLAELLRNPTGQPGDSKPWEEHPLRHLELEPSWKGLLGAQLSSYGSFPFRDNHEKPFYSSFMLGEKCQV